MGDAAGRVDADVVLDRAGRERAVRPLGARRAERAAAARCRSGGRRRGAPGWRPRGWSAVRSSAVPADHSCGRPMPGRGSRSRTCTGRRRGTRSPSPPRPLGTRPPGYAWQRDEKPAYAGGHQADGVALAPDWVELIEVELTGKRMPRYVSIFQAFRHRFNLRRDVSQVTYLCNAESARAVREALEIDARSVGRSLHTSQSARSTTSAASGRATPYPRGCRPQEHACR